MEWTVKIVWHMWIKHYNPSRQQIYKAQSMLVNTGGTSALIQQAIDGAGHTILGID